ncbi:MAG: hypothetical protein AB8B79_10275 [Granulosicoccus sp.]
MTGLLWLHQGAMLQFAIAVVALALTFLPGRTIRDPLLRYAFSCVTALLLAAHIVFGMQLGLYETSMLYDKVMHMIGSGAIAGLLLLAIHSYCSRNQVVLSSWHFSVLVFCGTLSAGTLWEIFEFTIDQTGMFYAQRGLQDTMIDLLADAAGAILLLALFAVAHLLKVKTAPLSL